MEDEAGTGRAGVEVVRAEPADIEAVLSILEEAARWLAARGIDQWQPGSSPRERLANRIERGEVFLAVLEGRPVGNIFLQWSDEETWGDVPDDAGYVHGLAIRRGLAGRGLGRELLRWAENRAAAAGRKYLRLDCAAGNRALNGYYRRAGFAFRGRASVRGLQVSLYEKEAGGLGAG